MAQVPFDKRYRTYRSHRIPRIATQAYAAWPQFLSIAPSIVALWPVPEEKIRLVVRDRRDKPISRTSLRKHFNLELETGATKLNAQVGNFMVSTIFGAKPPNGVTPITDERVRGRLGELFLKTRLGWRELDLGPKEERRAERGGNSREQWEADHKAIEDATRDLDAKLARLRRSVEAGETG